MIKELIKIILPQKIIFLYGRFRYKLQCRKLFLLDATRYCDVTHNNNTEQALLAKMMLICHSVEKGFTMPNFRYGFAKEKVSSLVDYCNYFIQKYKNINPQLHTIIKVISEYRLCHQQGNCGLDDILTIKIDNLLELFPDAMVDSIQVDKNRDYFFEYSEASFGLFSNSRHSVRNFSNESLDINLIYKAVKLAQNAPSSCNRQPVRVYIVIQKNIIENILKIQGGNRGFGHVIDKLIIVTGFLGGYAGANERNCVYVDTGIYVMNLVYSLHFYKISSCILNWSVDKERDDCLRRIINIPNDEIVSVMVACGNIPREFKICTSGRNNYKSIIKTI